MSVEQPEKLSTLNKQHKLCLQHLCLCFSPARKNLLQNDSEESLIYLCFRCWNFRRVLETFRRSLIKFSMCQHRTWNFKFFLLQLSRETQKFLLLSMNDLSKEKLHKSLNDVSSWNLFRSFPSVVVFSNSFLPLNFVHLNVHLRFTSIIDAWNLDNLRFANTKIAFPTQLILPTCRKCSRKHIESTTF